jgi:hypothetical protein
MVAMKGNVVSRAGDKGKSGLEIAPVLVLN